MYKLLFPPLYNLEVPKIHEKNICERAYNHLIRGSVINSKTSTQWESRSKSEIQGRLSSHFSTTENCEDDRADRLHIITNVTMNLLSNETSGIGMNFDENLFNCTLHDYIEALDQQMEMDSD